ncbi:DUF6493 family protein [Hymenobacter sp. H14-R3]|uniref:DUF6493 family protein n=1 Tax=Hymenobacter sp. H14-R3 TaxID=3046308 RepID=UPI0024BA9354|nr:DUF6493 family protein [Hymenobacter sp. H14-R3]MDJ0365795.1 DUF6493 family protein [Hymenobacter sp. H14-R3]
MTTASETFEHLIRHQSLAELGPFLLQLAPADIVPVRQKLLRLKAELTEAYQAPDQTSWIVPITLAQSEMLYVAGLATYSRKEALGRGFESQWADKWPPAAAAGQSAFLTVLAHARPPWLTDWLVGLARQADWEQRSAPYWLLHELLDRGLIPHEPWLFAQAAAHLLTTYNAQDTDEAEDRESCAHYFLQSLRADFPRLRRDLLLFFDYETPAQAAYFYGGKNGETFTWLTLLPALVESGHLERADLLTRCLLALRRDFRRPFLIWFKELFLALKPTLAERLARQAELTELLAQTQATVVNFALGQLKDLLPEPGFSLAPLLLVADSLLVRPDLKTGLRTLLAGLVKLPPQHPAHAPAVARLLATALAHPDAAVQERAAKGLAALLSAQKPLLAAAEIAALTATIGQQAELLGAAARPALAPWLAANSGVSITATVTYQANAQFVPDISAATAIAPVAGWHELLFLTGQVLKQDDDPAATERWLDGLLRLRGQLPAGYAAQLLPYVQQVFGWVLKDKPAAEVPATVLGYAYGRGENGRAEMLQALLAGWFTGFQQPTLANVSLLQRYQLPDPLLLLEQQRLGWVETQLGRASAPLPLLSTPSHAPHWLAPTALVEKLLAYQHHGVPPCPADLVLALARTAWQATPDAALARTALAALQHPGLRALLTWFLAPAEAAAASRHPVPLGQLAATASPGLPLADALPWLWAVAARTRYPEANLPELAPLADYPGVTAPWCPLSTQADDGLRLGPAAAGPPPSPLLLYSLHAGLLDDRRYYLWMLKPNLPFLLTLLPQCPTSLHWHLIGTICHTGDVGSEGRDVMQQALRALLPASARFSEATSTLLAVGLTHYAPICRALALEVLLTAVAQRRLAPAMLGYALGRILAAGLAPILRLTEQLAAGRALDALTDDALRQTLDALLPELPAAPPRNLRPLLDAYADLLARTRRPVPPAAQPNLLAWQQVASLKAGAKALLALAD